MSEPHKFNMPIIVKLRDGPSKSRQPLERIPANPIQATPETPTFEQLLESVIDAAIESNRDYPGDGKLYDIFSAAREALGEYVAGLRRTKANGAFLSDVAAVLMALGLGDHARP